MNDACDLYPDVPFIHKSRFYTNVDYKSVISQKRDPKNDEYYINVVALHDIAAGTELFAKYGLQYWAKYIAYFKKEDLNILMNSHYENTLF